MQIFSRPLTRSQTVSDRSALIYLRDPSRARRSAPTRSASAPTPISLVQPPARSTKNHRQRKSQDETHSARDPAVEANFDEKYEAENLSDTQIVQSQQDLSNAALSPSESVSELSSPVFRPLPVLWQYIPHRAKRAFRVLMRGLLTKYRAASSRPDERNSIIQNILAVPRNYLGIQLRKKKGQPASSDKKLDQRLRDASVGFRKINKNRSKQGNTNEIIDSTALGRKRNDDVDARTVRRAVRQFKKAGDALRAVRTLAHTSSQVEITESTIEELKVLHPAASEPLPGVPDNCTEITVDKTVLAGIIRKRFNNAASGGPSGWTGKLLFTLVADAECMEGLAVLVEDIINGRITDDYTRSLLLACNLVPTRKPSGGIRPIAVGETLCKLAAHYVMSNCLVPQAYSKLFPSIQKGVGVSGGCEQVVHIIRAGRQIVGEDGIVITVDYENAFNNRRRIDIWNALLAHCNAPDNVRNCNTVNLSPLLRLVHWMYAVTSPLVLPPIASASFMDPLPLLQSAEGCRQGDPLSALLFALSVQSLYEEAVRNEPPNTAILQAIQDDLTIVARPRAALRIFEKLVALSNKHGLKVQVSKCHVLPSRPHSESRSDEENSCINQLNSLGVHEGQSLHLLGCLLSNDGENGSQDTTGKLVKDWAEGVAVASNERFFNLLTHRDMPASIGFRLLCLSGLPRVSYLCRTMPPKSIENSLLRFDQMVLETLMKLLDLDSNLIFDEQFEITLAVIGMKRSLGGLGVRQQSDFSDIAFFSSFASSIPNLNALFDQFSTPVRQTRSMDNGNRNLVAETKAQLEQQINEALTAIRNKIKLENLTVDGLPSSPEELWTFHSVPYLQRHLSQQLSNTQHHLLVQKLQLEGDLAALARLRSCSHRSASLWLNAVPENEHLMLKNSHFHRAVRHRLGLAPCRRLPSISPYCLCVHQGIANLTEGDLIADPQHFHCCKLLKKTGCNTRHDHIVDALLDLCRLVDISATKSMNPLLKSQTFHSSSPFSATDEDDRVVPDLMVFLDDTRYYLDVSVTCPSANSYKTAAANTDLSAANIRSARKHAKYNAACEEIDSKFIPFVVESYGAVQSEAEQFLYMLSKRFDTTMEQLEFLIHARLRIAFALQKGNAELTEQGIRNLHRAALRPLSRQDDLPIPQRASSLCNNEDFVVPVVPVSPVEASPPPQPHPPDPPSPHQICCPSSAESSSATYSSPIQISIRTPLSSPHSLDIMNIANICKASENTTQMSSRQHEDAVDTATDASSNILLNTVSPSSVSTSALSDALTSTAATPLNTTSSVRSAAIANVSQAKSSAFPLATAFISNLERNFTELKEMKSTVPVECKQQTQYNTDNDKKNEKDNPASSSFSSSSSPTQSNPANNFDIYNLEFIQSERQRNRMNDSPSSSPSHRHRWND